MIKVIILMLGFSAPITSEYGYRFHPISGDHSFHKGIDIYAKRGTAIKAHAKGKVEFCGQSNGYGNTIIIKYKNHKFLYAHLDSINTVSGQEVKKGTTIGTVGSTGNSTGPHLHLEVYKHGQLINPRNL